MVSTFEAQGHWPGCCSLRVGSEKGLSERLDLSVLKVCFGMHSHLYLELTTCNGITQDTF